MKELKLRHHQRGILDFLFGSGDEEKESKSTETRTSTTDVAKTGTTEKSELLTLLGPEVQSELEGVFSQLASGIGKGTGETLKEIGDLVFTRASTAEQDLAVQNKAIISERRRVGERELTRLTTNLAQGAGGGVKSNTFVASATAEGRAALESQMAALEAALAKGDRTVATQELQLAAQILQSGSASEAQQVQALSSIVQVLRGATTTQEGTTASAETTAATEDITSVINSLVTGSKDEGLFGRLGTSFLDAVSNSSFKGGGGGG